MMAQERQAPRGLVIVNTGDGKGKTTASLGLAVRAAGNGLRVLIIQFIKGRWKTGESQSLPKLEPNIQFVRMGMGFTIERLRDPRVPMEEHEEAAAKDKSVRLRALVYAARGRCSVAKLFGDDAMRDEALRMLEALPEAARREGLRMDGLLRAEYDGLLRSCGQ